MTRDDVSYTTEAGDVKTAVSRGHSQAETPSEQEPYSALHGPLIQQFNSIEHQNIIVPKPFLIETVNGTVHLNWYAPPAINPNLLTMLPQQNQMKVHQPWQPTYMTSSTGGFQAPNQQTIATPYF